MRRILFIIYFFIGSFSFFYTEQSYALVQFLKSSRESFKVDKIELTGNFKTKDYIVHRELILKVGDTVSPEEIERDRLRILNTKLFERVRTVRKEINGENILEFRLTERLYVLPMPVFKINEKDWSKISYGASITHNNFRGRAERIAGIIWRGYDPAYIINFHNPWIAGKKKILLKANCFHIKKRSKSIEYNRFTENRTGIYGGVGKRFGLFLWTNFNLGIENISTSRRLKGGAFSETGSDRFFNGYFEIVYDNRDLRKYPRSGWYNSCWFSKTRYIGGNHDFLKYGFYISTFKALRENVIFAFNLFSTLSSGRLPSYSKEYFGYDRRIRGHYFSKLEGDNLWGNIIELRLPLFSPQYLTWESAPVLGKYFKNLEFGMGCHFFIDSGSIWSRSDNFFEVPLYKGYGAGLHFRLPYDGFIRVDFAVNEKRKLEILIIENLAF